MIRSRLAALTLLFVCGSLSLDAPRALPAVERQVCLEVTLDLLPTDPSSNGDSLATRNLVVVPGDRGVPLELDFAWPDKGRPSHLRLELRGALGSEDEGDEVVVESWLRFADGRTAHGSRSTRLREGSTRLLEIFAERGRRLFLALQGSRAERPVVRSGPVSSRAVRFGLEIQRVEGERAVSLETNVLDTFVGESVEYSFHRGEEEDLESLRLLLRPVRIEGEIVEIAAEVNGTLPGQPTRFVLSRSERLIATRGAASSVTVGAEGSKTAYRFLVTPEF